MSDEMTEKPMIETPADFGHFLLEEALQEQRACAAKDDFRVLVFVIHLHHYGAYGITFAVEKLTFGNIEFSHDASCLLENSENNLATL